MKLYVMSGAVNGIDSIDGMYYLIAETGECLASHFCSCKYFAKGDLYERRPERIEKFTKRFGDIEVLYSCAYLISSFARYNDLIM